jgi:hypothetical protein
VPVAQVRRQHLPAVPKMAKEQKQQPQQQVPSAASPLDRSSLHRSASGSGVSSMQNAQSRALLSEAALTAVDDVYSLKRQISAMAKRLAAAERAQASAGSSSAAGLWVGIWLVVWRCCGFAANAFAGGACCPAISSSCAEHVGFAGCVRLCISITSRCRCAFLVVWHAWLLTITLCVFAFCSEKLLSIFAHRGIDLCTS